MLCCVCKQERDTWDSVSPLLSQVLRASMVIRSLLLSGNALGHKDTGVSQVDRDQTSKVEAP